MVLNGILLKNAIDFIAQAKSDGAAYSEYVKLTFFPNGKLSIKLSSDVIFAIECSYSEPNSETWGIAEEISFVINLSSIKNYITSNPGEISLDIQDTCVLFKGKGNLRLAYIVEEQYANCDFSGNRFTNFVSTENSISLNNVASLENWRTRLANLIIWADSATPATQYKNIFFNEKGSARLYKYHLSVLDNNISTEFGSALSCNSLIDVTSLKILSSLKGLNSLSLSFSKESDPIQEFSFIAIDENTNIEYKLKSRLFIGKHPIQEIENSITKTLDNNVFMTFEKKKMMEVLKRAQGYCEKENIALCSLNGVQDGVELEFIIKNMQDEYKDTILVKFEHENNISFNTFKINIDVLNLCLNKINEVEPKLYLKLDSSNAVVAFCFTTDEGTDYIFPASN
jgi:hypothetical protein